MIRKILIVLVLVIVALVAVIATRPRHFSYTRSTTIAAPPEKVFEQINDLKKFKSWNPWAKLDPNCVIAYSGPATGVDSAYTWKGNDQVGEGKMTLIESKPHELVRARMDFIKPFAGTSTAEFTFKPDASGKTVVSWGMSGDNDFIGKAISLIMDCDKMIGGQFDQGLAALKQQVEAAK